MSSNFTKKVVDLCKPCHGLLQPLSHHGLEEILVVVLTVLVSAQDNHLHLRALTPQALLYLGAHAPARHGHPARHAGLQACGGDGSAEKSLSSPRGAVENRQVACDVLVDLLLLGVPPYVPGLLKPLEELRASPGGPKNLVPRVLGQRSTIS